MKLIWIVMFAISSLALIVVLMRNQLSRLSLKKVIVHWIIAATVLFLMNYFEFIEPYALPINPLTIGTTAVLGLPGIALLMGTQYLIG
ncbi:MAG: pro-sigmaK processing inhibitor BofA family protein [Candidatus Pristimantibacillus lignocellulolyticus]|uniref:Pro-sigmaK processing inhibitor BofA family protein n=1 Tax=Candidatus Pristimantibacillus lignocellulolyticus TaxID=2994561 RepID=A0A9J6ZHI9_9BACL|nr:MAG: pro-sigmaK processing inhibitor BofA family protein [Candidatus Pristimantibacillus lignocellulolyticus]